MAYRKALLYPPFVDLLVIGFVGEREELVRKAAEVFLHRLGGKFGPGGSNPRAAFCGCCGPPRRQWQR